MIKCGIYVDAENIRLCGGYGMRYDVLMDYASMDGSIILRANSYVVEDQERTAADDEYRSKLYRYHNVLRRCGFKLIKKYVQRYTDQDGEVTVKADADMNLAIDALLQSRNLDRIVLLTGDGDYCRLIQALQNRGCRVDVIGFLNVSTNLKEAADYYFSGFMIPGLLPITSNGNSHRGYPASYKSDKGYGFLRHYEREKNRLVEKEIYFHHSHLEEDYPADVMSHGRNIFEYNLVPSSVKDGDMMATHINLAYTRVQI